MLLRFNSFEFQIGVISTMTSKPIYLMAGGRGSKSPESIIKTILQDTGKSNPIIAYVGAANEDNWTFYLMVAALIKKAGDCQIKRILIASRKADLNKARADLESADAIFMSGGDVEAGMKVLQIKNMAGLLKELFLRGKLFFGSSAGSIMLAKEWVGWKDPEDDSTADLFPCLGMTSLICDTHAEEDDWEELKAALKLKKENVTGYGIPSGSCLKVYPDGRVEALGGIIIQYLKQNGVIIKMPNLSP
jgi:peptidase E